MAFLITSTSSSTPILFNFESKFKLIKSIDLNRKQQPNALNLGQVPPSLPSPSIRRRSFLLLCSSSSLLSEMGSSASEGLYPLHRSKTIHLVRHAQGIHNVAGEKDHSAYLSEELFDAHLTTLGWQQVDNLRKHVHASGLSKSVELVVVSPLLRTMQTAVGAFGGEGSVDGNDVPPLMAENTGKSNRPAISNLNCPPFIAVELCREHLHQMSILLFTAAVYQTLGGLKSYPVSDSVKALAQGVHPCDRRRSISEYKPMFPAIDFSLIENDGDVLWTAGTREKNEEVAARGVKFIKWLLTREEKEIAVVTHSGFLFHTLLAYGDDCHPTLKKEMSKHFNNCELRSVVIVDRSMIGSTPSKTDFPGKIPSGADVPSDAV